MGYDPGFLQGTITQIGSTNWTIQIDAGYPAETMLLDGNGRLSSLYDSSGNLVQNGSEVYTGAFSNNGGGSFTFQASGTLGWHQTAP